MNDPFGISKMIPKDPRSVIRAGRRLKNIKYSKEYEKRYQRSKSYSPPFLPGNKRATPEWNNYVARDKESYLSTGKISKADDKKVAAGAAVGGAVGQGTYQLAGYGPKWALRTNTKIGYAHNKKFSEITDPKIKSRKKTWEKAKKTQAKQGLSAKKDPQFWRTLPKEVHGSKVLRTTGWTHSGKTGVATGAVATTTGALIGIRAAKKEKK